MNKPSNRQNMGEASDAAGVCVALTLSKNVMFTVNSLHASNRFVQDQRLCALVLQHPCGCDGATGSDQVMDFLKISSQIALENGFMVRDPVA